MAGKKRRGQKTPNFSTTNPAVNNARAKKLDSYEDTLEPGSTDERESSYLRTRAGANHVDIFRRDQIMFNPQDESDGDDDLGPEGEEVLSLNLPRRRDQQDEDFEEEDYEEEEDDEEEVPTKSKKEKAKEKAKNDLLTKGRFGKPIVSSDEEDEGSSSGSGSGSEDDEEGWGRSYYSRPSSRKEKEDLRGEYDEKKEEEREMEIKEVKRLQRKAREGLADDDWGLADDAEESEP
jgi:U3 small nucleolar RNA-associated protein 3